MQESGENYLETILVLQKRNGYVRSIDVAHELNYSKPSISRAMGILRRQGLVEMAADGNLTLTQSGQEKAEAIYERHLLIHRFLELTLGIEHEAADRDACRIEHVISEEVFQRIKTFVEDKTKVS